jgi:hypothetical protein
MPLMLFQVFIYPPYFVSRLINTDCTRPQINAFCGEPIFEVPIIIRVVARALKSEHSSQHFLTTWGRESEEK